MTYPDYLIPPAILICAVLLDRRLGDPARWHPLAGFGNIASWLEARMNSPRTPPMLQRLSGVGSVLLLLVPITLASLLASTIPMWGIAIQVLLLYFAIGATSLAQHARAVKTALDQNDLDLARVRVGMIVSRDTRAMQPDDIAKATIESVLENGNDAVFGALFWFAACGVPGAVAYRLANTLDAMWGYRTPRYIFFGWAAARLDDVLNWIPARLTALSYSLLGSTRSAWQCWQQQGRQWYSPNAGPVMAAGAGALGIVLGGAASYHGSIKQRPMIGMGQPAQPQDIERAITLVQRSMWLWVTLMVAGAQFHA